MDEYRLLQSRGRGKRKKGSRYDRMPLSLYDEVLLERTEDFIQVIPYELEDPFTVKEFAQAAHIKRELAQITLHILHYMKLLDRPGKRGREYLYEVVSK